MTPKRSWTSKRGDSNFDHHLSILSKCIWKLGKDLQIWNRTSKPPHPSNDNHNRVAQGHDEAETCWQDRKLQIIWVVRTHSRIPIYLMLKQRSSSKKKLGMWLHWKVEVDFWSSKNHGSLETSTLPAEENPHQLEQPNSMSRFCWSTLRK